MTTDNERIAELEARTGPKKRPCDRHAYYREDIEFLLAILKRKSAALEEAKRALRFVCHECDVDDVRTRPACWDALARIESLEHGKTNDA